MHPTNPPDPAGVRHQNSAKEATAAGMMLRLSVTENCNFRCRYCIPPGTRPRARQLTAPPLDELAGVVRWLAANLGVRRVKLTGGEPLLRAGLAELAAEIGEMDGIAEVSLTTNGSLLARQASRLKAAGITRVNVSLDTLDPDRFRDLNGGSLADTLDGIDAALEAGLRPLKLNAVLRRSTWRCDVPELLDFAAGRGLELRFIELMSSGAAAVWARGEYVAAGEVIQRLDGALPMTVGSIQTGSVARLSSVIWNGAEVRVGWITPQSRPFCDNCNRLRLDSRGNLRRCLMDPEQLPLLELLCSGHSPLAAVAEYLGAKRPPAAMSTGASMALLGG